MSILDTARDLGATHIATAIKCWDKQDIERLQGLLEALRDYCDSNDLHPDDYIDMTALPSADIPKDVDTGYPVWAMDADGNMLVGNDFDVMSLTDYRAEHA